MTIKQVAEMYFEIQEYRKTVKEGDTPSVEMAEEAIQELQDWLRSKNSMHYHVFRECVHSLRTHNELLVVTSPLHDDKDITEYLNCLKENGFEKFAFASGMSGAISDAWAYQKTGMCQLIGFGEFVSMVYDDCDESYVTRPALIFKIL